MTAFIYGVGEGKLCYFLVSSVLEVFPEDPKQPRMIRTGLDGKAGITNGHLELDTIESAREWRREIQGK